jgi:parallel beta-helix repeat protein
MQITNTDYAQISQLVLIGAGSNGITVNSSTFVTIASNALFNASPWGLQMTADNSSVIGNEVAGNGAFFSDGGGMQIAGNGNTISGNMISVSGTSSQPKAGIVVNTVGSRIFGNISDGNWGVGIQVTGTRNQLFNNKAIGNSSNDLQDDNANCGSNLWSDNTFYTRSPASCVK